MGGHEKHTYKQQDDEGDGLTAYTLQDRDEHHRGKHGYQFGNDLEIIGFHIALAHIGHGIPGIEGSAVQRVCGLIYFHIFVKALHLHSGPVESNCRDFFAKAHFHLIGVADSF